MKRILAGIIALIFTTLACESGTATQPVDSVSTIVASTMQAFTQNAPLPTQAEPTATVVQPSGISVTFQNVSFVIPDGLASGATGEQVAAVDQTSGAPWDVAPAHIEFTLSGYNGSLAKFNTIKLWIYPAQDFAAVSNGANISLQRLNTFLANPSTPVTNDTLPQVPTFNAAQMFASNVQVINFKSGQGVRMVTQYGQAVGAVDNDGTFYHFEGLTGNGKYYVVAVLPVGNPILPSGDNPDQVPAGGVPFPGYTSSIDPKDYETYFQAVADKLNAAAPETFTPTLTDLDKMIESLQVSP
ncbi:MAG TPA: hypothetical protein VHM28_10455 [Anaerolineales bacterium]|jgi:hypothetical protein|nr:hypothetical protein [Anaerolineales bacterium]